MVAVCSRGLAGVASLSGVTQTVVTGNIRGPLEVKLNVIGLDFRIDWAIGAYGETTTSALILCGWRSKALQMSGS